MFLADTFPFSLSPFHLLSPVFDIGESRAAEVRNEATMVKGIGTAGVALLCLLLAGCGLVSFTVTNSPDVICPNPRTGLCNN